jgi:cytochrome b subunit of formate dehydrogenase
MFILGVSIRDKENQDRVYPIIGPIFGFFEIGSLIVLVITGTLMIIDNGLITILFDDAIYNRVIDSLRYKLILVAIMAIITILHTYIAFKTNGKKRTRIQMLVSRASSMGIFILNFIILHFAIIIRDTL